MFHLLKDSIKIKKENELYEFDHVSDKIFYTQNNEDSSICRKQNIW